MGKLGKTPPAAEITPEPLYLRRREFIRDALLFTVTSTGVGGSLLWLMGGNRASEPRSSPASVSAPSLTSVGRSSYSTDEPLTPYRDVTTYNNFYEFGTDKGDPAENAHTLRPRPWTVTIEGEGPQAAGDGRGAAPRVVPTRGTRLPHALRRGVVDGDPLGRLPAGRSSETGRTDIARQVRGLHD